MRWDALLRFYLACIEEEDLRTLQLAYEGKRHVPVGGDREILFDSGAAGAVNLPDPDGGLRRFVTERSATGQERLFYAYPSHVHVRRDDEGGRARGAGAAPRRVLSPLFFVEVEVDVGAAAGAGGLYVRAIPIGPIQTNLELLHRLAGLQLEEALEFRARLEDEGVPFADRLETALRALAGDGSAVAREGRVHPAGAGGSALGLRPDRLDPALPYRPSNDLWLNRPVLFLSERSQTTMHLRDELAALVSDSTLLAAIPRTALGTVFGGDERLSAPTRPADPAGPTASAMPMVPIVPLNPSQRAAVDAALSRPLTVITGPPGSGKSQAAVTMLATAAYHGRPMLFASKNNQAVDVVRHRLSTLLGELDLSLRLGSRAHTEQAESEIQEKLARIWAAVPQRHSADPPRPAPRVPEDLVGALHAARNAREATEAELARLSAALGDFAMATQRESEARAQVPPEWQPATQPFRDAERQQGPRRGPSGQAARRWGRAERPLRRAERLLAALQALPVAPPLVRLLATHSALVRRLLYRLLSRDVDTLLASLPPPVQEVVSLPAGWGAASASQARRARGRVADDGVGLAALAGFVRSVRAYRTWILAMAQRDRAWAAVTHFPPATDLERRLDESASAEAEAAQSLLKATWASRVAASHHRLASALASYFAQVRGAPRSRSPRAVLDQVTTIAPLLPIWIVTNLSVRRALPLVPGLFDLVIIDEASQCDPASAIPLLFRARRAVIVGDPHQLRHVAVLRADEEKSLAKRSGLPVEALDRFSYVTHSLYRIAERSALSRGEEPLWLEEHYRSHPDIITFSNEAFYQGRLRIRTRLADLTRRLAGLDLGVYWHDVPGHVDPSPHSALNEPEAQEVVALLDKWRAAGIFEGDRTIGVVAPFRRHIERIEELLRARPWYDATKERIRLGTAHRFQGDECDVVIFSPVVAEGLRPMSRDWVARREYQLLNVAVTRARGALHVVGDRSACLAAGGYLAEFARWVGGEVRPGVLHFNALSRAEQAMALQLRQHGLWFRPHVLMDGMELDFLVVGAWGGRYDLEVDGSQHRSEAAVVADRRRDDVLSKRGLRVVRIPAWMVVGDGALAEPVSAVLRRLV